MKMKKYIAPSIAEAMKLIREELGEDAVILSSKVVISKKYLGLVKEKNFEVLAGVDTGESSYASRNNVKQSANHPLSEQNKLSQVRAAREEKFQNQLGVSEELKKELDDLKKILQLMYRQTSQKYYPDELMPIIEFLKRQELSDELITYISDEIYEQFKQNGKMTKDEMFEIIRQLLYAKLEPLNIGGVSFEHKYVNVLGPTGVGKTTTIAKMAARSVLEKKKKIGFITTDTYRIGAIEQLKTYAALLQAPVEVVYNENDYKQAIENLAHLDLIFIDTAGRNYKEAKYINDVQKLINFDEDVESYLVLSTTSKESDMATIIELFLRLPIEKFIFTKVDETNSIGAMFNLMIKYNKGLAYYTNGQEVPEDIEEASIEGLLDLFFQGEKL